MFWPYVKSQKFPWHWGHIYLLRQMYFKLWMSCLHVCTSTVGTHIASVYCKCEWSFSGCSRISILRQAGPVKRSANKQWYQISYSHYIIGSSRNSFIEATSVILMILILLWSHDPCLAQLWKDCLLLHLPT